MTVRAGGTRRPFSRSPLSGSGAAMSFDFTGASPSLTSPQGIPLSMARSTSGYYYNSAGVLTSAAINAARFDYDPTYLTSNGLLIEQPSTNLMLQSNTFTDAAWTKMDVTLTGSQTGPDNTASATLVTEGVANIAVVTENSAAFTAGITVTHSIYVKRGTATWIRLRQTDGATNLSGGQAWFNLATGQKGTVALLMTGTGYTSNMQYIAATGYYRLSITGAINAGATTARFEVCSADADNSLLRLNNATYTIFNAQCEGIIAASSPIITTAATVTRGADLLTAATGSWYNPTEGTIITEAQSFTPNSANFQYLYSFDDTTTNNRIAGNFQATNTAAMVVSTGGVVQANITTTSISAGQYNKSANAYKVNDFATSVNGGTVGTDVAGTIPTVTIFRLGAAANGIGLNGWIRNFAYYRTRRVNADLITLSASVTPNYWVTASNHTGIPADLLSVLDDINHTTTNEIYRVTGPAGFSQIKSYIVNGRWGANTEQNAGYEAEVWHGYRLNGTVYQATMAGVSSAILAATAGAVMTDPQPALNMGAGVGYWEITKKRATDYLTAAATITAISNATTCVVTIGGGHSLLDGQKVRFISVGGMTQLNYATNGSVNYTVRNPTATTFELYNLANSAPINSTAFGAYTSGGTANRLYNHYNCVLTTAITQDGCIRTTNGAVDQYALPYGARVNKVPTINGAGVITAVGVAAGGANYSAGGNLTFFTGIPALGDAAQEKPGSGLIGTYNRTGAVITSTTITNGGSGYDAANPAETYMGGTNLATNGYGGNLHAFGPIATFGKPSVAIPNQIWNGDSILAGGGGSFSSNNGVLPTGDVGVLERYNAAKGGFLKMAINGESMAGFLANNTRRLAIVDDLISKGVMFTQAGTNHAANDFRTSTGVPSATFLARLQSWINLYTTRCKYGAIVCTPLPSTTSNSAGPLYFTTQAEQISGAFANYDAGGSVDQTRTALRNGSHGLIGLAAVLDWAAPVSDDSSGLTRFASGIYGPVSAMTYNEPSAPGQSVHLNGAAQRRVFEATAWVQPLV